MRNEDFDPIAGLYESAGSLRELAEMYRDERGGLSSLLLLIADNVTRCAGSWKTKKVWIKFHIKIDSVEKIPYYTFQEVR